MGAELENVYFMTRKTPADYIIRRIDEIGNIKLIVVDPYIPGRFPPLSGPGFALICTVLRQKNQAGSVIRLSMDRGDRLVHRVRVNGKVIMKFQIQYDQPCLIFDEDKGEQILRERFPL
jgi:hypothetical protein